MTTGAEDLGGVLADAVVARDFARIRELLHTEIDFRGMTPTRLWVADGPAGVEETFCTWLEHPEREVDRIEPTDRITIQDTARVGWLVHGRNAQGPFTFEQQAYVREQDGRIVWLRVMCTGPRPA